MAYVTGTANSMTDLLLALQNACISNGWTLSGSTLTNGTCVVEVTAGTTYMMLRGGTGVDGGGAIVGASPSVYMTAVYSAQWTWPATYHIFVGTSEVYLVANYAIENYPWMAFGTTTPIAPGGTGNWVSSLHDRTSAPSNGPGTINWSKSYGGFYNISPALFSSERRTNQVHADIDGGGAAWHGCAAQLYTNYLCSMQPNAWNDESVLAPIQAGIGRTSSKMSFVLSALADARYVRIDNYNPGEIITLGQDRWMVFPWFCKRASNPNHGDNDNGTGTFGHAIRYDGP